MQRLRSSPRFTASATLGDLIQLLGLRYGEGFRYGALIWGDVAIVVDGLLAHDVDLPLKGRREIEVALIPMLVGGRSLGGGQ